MESENVYRETPEKNRANNLFRSDSEVQTERRSVCTIVTSIMPRVYTWLPYIVCAWQTRNGRSGGSGTQVISEYATSQALRPDWPDGDQDNFQK